jgi:hypothetical protein
MLSHAVTGSLDLDDDGVVQEAVQEGGCYNLIAEDVAPFGEAAVGGKDHCAALVTSVDQLEEEVSPTRRDGQVANLVDDQQRGAAQIADAFAQGALALSLCESGHELGE